MLVILSKRDRALFLMNNSYRTVWAREHRENVYPGGILIIRFTRGPVSPGGDPPLGTYDEYPIGNV